MEETKMNYVDRVKGMTKTIHLELLNNEQVDLTALQMKIKCEYGLGDRSVNKHLEQLKKMGIIDIQEELVKATNQDALRGMIIK